MNIVKHSVRWSKGLWPGYVPTWRCKHLLWWYYEMSEVSSRYLPQFTIMSTFIWIRTFIRHRVTATTQPGKKRVQYIASRNCYKFKRIVSCGKPSSLKLKFCFSSTTYKATPPTSSPAIVPHLDQKLFQDSKINQMKHMEMRIQTEYGRKRC